MRQLVVSLPPHIHASFSTSGAMWRVVIALMPALLCSFWVFGIGALIVTAASVLSCIVVEYVINRFMLRRSVTIPDGSALLTGLLLGMNLPSNLPVWIVILGAIVAIGVGKMSFGGLGCNIFNPALVGRVFLLLSFPAQMTTWPLPGAGMEYTDAATGATLLGALKMGGAAPNDMGLMDAFVGYMGGSLGEVGSLALLLGGIYLLLTRVITWHIPASILLTVALFCWALGVDVPLALLSGGLLLGAIFMATDYVTSPMTHAGMIVYGVGIGVVTVVVRQWGAYPEGVSFAILLMNGCTPLINRLCRPRRFGERRAAV
ncbi:MAG: RnfABCDGE type electron transport complex subunit D [Muribaculaceae bacterium]|nr:RnfABCDGE type electron transport complex subunit D [Muribaculaceae bacterium]